MSGQWDEEAILEAVESEIERIGVQNRRVFFGVNLGLFSVMMLIAWSFALDPNSPIGAVFFGMTAGADAGTSPVLNALLLATIGWTGALVMQGAGVIGELPAVQRAALERRLRRRLGVQAAAEILAQKSKRKRQPRQADERYALSDDGERVSLDDAAERRQQGSHR